MKSGLVIHVLFYTVALLTLLCASFATFSRNIVRAVFSLLGTFFGVAILYGMLSAEFIAAIQILVYVGGILVLMLFAVMLTGNIENADSSSRTGSVLQGSLIGIASFVILAVVAISSPWKQVWDGSFEAITPLLGNYLLQNGLLPFEILSVLLLAVVIGTVVVARSVITPNNRSKP